MSMDKIKKPNAQEVFDIFLLALQDEQVKLEGDIGGFKLALYDGFKAFTIVKSKTKKCFFT